MGASAVPPRGSQPAQTGSKDRATLLMGSLLVAIECTPAVRINRQVAPLRLVRVQVAGSLSVVVYPTGSAIHKS